MSTPQEFPRLLNACRKEVNLKNVGKLEDSHAKFDGVKRPLIVAVFNQEMIGHVNPTFSLVQEFVKRGCRVHYFLPANQSFRTAAAEAGAIVENYTLDDPDNFKLDACGDFDVCEAPHEKYDIWPLASTLATGEYLISRCRELDVGVVLYDPMAPHGLLVARALRVPSISLVTFPGLGSIADLLADESRITRGASLRRPLGEEVLARFGVDLQSDALSRFQWLADDDNFVTTSEALTVPLPPLGKARWADETRHNFHFTSVGCTANPSAPHVIGTVESKEPKDVRASSQCCLSSTLPTQRLEAARAEGKRIVYVALGTMALKDRWAIDVGTVSGGNIPDGTTGKMFCQHIWQSLFGAMKELGDGYECVVSVGTQGDALDFLEGDTDESRLKKVPENVTVCSFVQQMQILRYANVFVSHAGFNSMQESLIAGVPLIAVPQAVDQPSNARKIETSGWGRAFLQPMDTVSPTTLAQALCEVAAANSSYHQEVAAACADLSGGEVRAVDRVFEIVSANATMLGEQAR